MGWTEKVVKGDEEYGTYWVLDRRVRWSPYWWLSLILLGVAVILLVVPVSSSFADEETTLRCGSLVSSAEVTLERDGQVREGEELDESECEERRSARGDRVLAFGVVALLPFWLGRRDLRRRDVRPEHLAAMVCVGVCLMLLIGPHESSKESECGSPLWAEVTDTGSDGDADTDSCLVERPSRVAWAMLWGVAAVPFAMAASRAHKEDDEDDA